jgi:hypothetical protein
MTQLLNRLKQNKLADLAGTNLAISLPISEGLLQEVLDARPPDTPVKELKVQLLADSEAILHLAVDAPVIGMTNRTLRLKLRGTVEPGRQDWLHFDITDGLRFFDKPLLGIVGKLVADKLPGGVRLDSNTLSIHHGEMLNKADIGYLYPAVSAARLESRQGQLVVNLHLIIADSAV